MGTHPIFESDFDCLTDILEFVWGLPIGLVFCLQLVTPKGLSRDSDFVIKQRIYVTLAFTSVVYAIYYFYYSKYHTPKLYEKELNDIDAVTTVLWTVIYMVSLYLGPVIYCISSGKYPDAESTLIKIRTLVVAPLCEEIIFRKIILTLLLSAYDTKKAILLALASFSLPHLHHFLHEYQSLGYLKAIQESVFRIIYTSIFGLLSSVLFIKTNTILSPILAHVWCNYFGILFIPQNGNIFNLLAYILGLVLFIGLITNGQCSILNC